MPNFQNRTYAGKKASGLGVAARSTDRGHTLGGWLKNKGRRNTGSGGMGAEIAHPAAGTDDHRSDEGRKDLPITLPHPAGARLRDGSDSTSIIIRKSGARSSS